MARSQSRSGPFTFEKLGRHEAIATEQTFAAATLPDNEFSIAQRLARRWLKHQNFSEELSRYGIQTPHSELSLLQSLRNQHLTQSQHVSQRSRSPIKSSSHVRAAKSLELQKKKPQSHYTHPRHDIISQRTTFNPLPQHDHPVRQCERLLKAEQQQELTNAQQEVQQMRRAIKFYTERLAELQAKPKLDDLSHHERSRSSERCLNAQVSRTLYSLKQQLERAEQDRPKPTIQQRASSSMSQHRQNKLTLQQLNAVHKSAIRCLQSFVHQHDASFAPLSSFERTNKENHKDARAEEERIRRADFRSPSPLPPAPLPSAQMYGQLCSLLEKLSHCYDLHSPDQEFAEAIRKLRPESSRSNLQKQRSSKSPTQTHVSSRKMGARRSDEKHERETPEKATQTQLPTQKHFSRVEDISFQSNAAVKKLGKSSMIRPKKVLPKKKTPTAKSGFLEGLISDRNKSTNQSQVISRSLQSSPLNLNNTSRNSCHRDEEATYQEKRPENRKRDKSPVVVCSHHCQHQNLMDIEAVRQRLRRMEVEASEIRNRWLNSKPNVHQFSYPQSTFEQHNTSQNAADWYIDTGDRQFLATKDLRRVEKPSDESDNFMANVLANTSSPAVVTKQKPSSPNESTTKYPSASRIVENFLLEEDETEREGSLFFNRITDIVQNKILDGLVQDTVDCELARFEEVADRLVDHLLQAEMLHVLPD